MKSIPKTFAVDPQRFAWGHWCHKRNRQIGEGDIGASYSADRIGGEGAVRRPFRHEGVDWVATSTFSNSARAYRLVHPSQFEGGTLSYVERVSDGHRGRCAPEGFYHGMRVKRGREEMVLCGPETKFIAGEPEQGSLF